MRRLGVAAAIVVLIVLASTACTSVRYYGQAVRGGLGVAFGAKPIEKVLADGQLDAESARQLALVEPLRTFARDTLGLEVGKQYTRYRDLGRDVVVWNVVAAPELSVVPIAWCFPIAGCVSYRGYFKRPPAERFAEHLRDQGFDVRIGGATAYSTLGWLRDPVLNTFLGGSDAELAALLFHELAHATLYAKGDTAFNESFATVIEHAGVHRWLATQDREAEWRAFAENARAERAITDRLARLRDDLDTLYRSARSEDEKSRAKTETLDRFQSDLASAIERDSALAPWQGWTERSINNADLASVGVYWQWVEPLEALLEDIGWPQFLDRMHGLADLDSAARQTALEALAANSITGMAAAE